MLECRGVLSKEKGVQGLSKPKTSKRGVNTNALKRFHHVGEREKDVRVLSSQYAISYDILPG